MSFVWKWHYTFNLKYKWIYLLSINKSLWSTLPEAGLVQISLTYFMFLIALYTSLKPPSPAAWCPREQGLYWWNRWLIFLFPAVSTMAITQLIPSKHLIGINWIELIRLRFSINISWMIKIQLSGRAHNSIKAT